MPPPRRVSPVEALEAVTRDPPIPRPERVRVEHAAGRCLAGALRVPAAPPGDPREDPPGGGAGPRATIDGYLLTGPPTPGRELLVVGSVGRAQATPARRLPPGEALRIECGARIAAPDAVLLSVEDVTIVGSDRIRIDGIADEGGPSRRDGIHRDVDVRLPSGTPLDARARSLLLARGIEEVDVRARLRVGVLAIGRELCRPRGRRRSDPSGEGEWVDDVTTGWLREAIGDLGCDVLRLGVVGDDPDAIRRVLLATRSRKPDVVVLVGGLGDGLEDRTVEAIQGLDCHLTFERVSLDRCPTFLYARGLGFEWFGLSGLPGRASVAWDLWLRPALAARLGELPARWDWTLSRPGRPRPEARGPGERPGERSATAVWRLRPLPVEDAPPDDPWSPWSGAPIGWRLDPPASTEDGDTPYFPGTGRPLR